MSIIKLLNKHKSKLKKIKLICVGDIILDKYIVGEVNRISPEYPVPILDQKKQFVKLGGAGNVANNIASVGVQAMLLYLNGKDKPSKDINKLLKRIKGIKPKPIYIENFTTPVKTRYIDKSHQILRLDNEKKNKISKKEKLKIIKVFKKEVKTADLVIISDYDKGLLDENMIQEIIAISKINKKIIIADPKKDSFRCFKGVDLITPNLEEFKKAVKVNIYNENKLVSAAQEICKKLSIKEILITRSSKGMSLFNKSSIKNIEALKREVSDVTGAGDTVVAILSIMKAVGLSSYQASKIANLAASKTVSKIGASTLSLEELTDDK